MVLPLVVEKSGLAVGRTDTDDHRRRPAAAQDRDVNFLIRVRRVVVAPKSALVEDRTGDGPTARCAQAARHHPNLGIVPQHNRPRRRAGERAYHTPPQRRNLFKIRARVVVDNAGLITIGGKTCHQRALAGPQDHALVGVGRVLRGDHAGDRVLAAARADDQPKFFHAPRRWIAFGDRAEDRQLLGGQRHAIRGLQDYAPGPPGVLAALPQTANDEPERVAAIIIDDIAGAATALLPLAQEQGVVRRQPLGPARSAARNWRWRDQAGRP